MAQRKPVKAAPGPSDSTRDGWTRPGWNGSPYQFPEGSASWSAEQIEAWVATRQADVRWKAHRELNDALLRAMLLPNVKRSPAHARMLQALLRFMELADPTLAPELLLKRLSGMTQARRGGRPRKEARSRELVEIAERRLRANRSGRPIEDVFDDVADEWNAKNRSKLAGVNYLDRPATTILAGWKRGMISL